MSNQQVVPMVTVYNAREIISDFRIRYSATMQVEILLSFVSNGEILLAFVMNFFFKYSI